MLLLMVFGCFTSVRAQDHFFKKVLNEAQKGNVNSKICIGLYYDKGLHGCTKNIDKALYWYVEGIKGGDHRCYVDGKGYVYEAFSAVSDIMTPSKRNTLTNPGDVFQLFKDGVTGGASPLKKFLGDCYYDGFGVAKDYSQAMFWYENYSKDSVVDPFWSSHYVYGYGLDWNRMGRCCSYGLGVTVDYRKAFHYLKKSTCNTFSVDEIFDLYQKTNGYDAELDVDFFVYFIQALGNSWKRKTTQIIKEDADGWIEGDGIYRKVNVSRFRNRPVFEQQYVAKDEKEYADKATDVGAFKDSYDGTTYRDSCYSVEAYCIGNAREIGRGVSVDVKQAKIYYALAIKYATYRPIDQEVKQLAQQALDRLNGNGIRPPQPGNLPNITFLSPSSSSSTSYNLKACIKSSSQISGVKVTLNGSMVINRTRGFDPVPNDGCAYTIDQTLTLKNGFRNEIIVSITNSKGTKTDTLYVSVGGSPIPPQPKEKRVALVIGNSNYQKSPLKNPVNDATDIAAKLRNLGFQVTLKTDLTHYGFDNTLKNFENQAKGSEIALVFYAGHGMEADGVTYLIPTDAPIDDLAKLKYESVNANYMLEKIVGAKKMIVILDACRTLPDQRDPMHGGLGILSATNAFFAYSTSPGKTAPDGQGRNSPYTSALLAALDYKNMTLPQLFQKVSQEVTKNSSQIPWTSSSLVDDVILNK